MPGSIRTRMTTYLFIAAVALALPACSVSASTANVSAATMARDAKGEEPTKTYSPDEPFYCIVELANAPDDTAIRAVWTAVRVEGVDPETRIDEASATGGSGQVQFDLTNDGPWPPGEYRVDVYLDDDERPARSLEFRVE